MAPGPCFDLHFRNIARLRIKEHLFPFTLHKLLLCTEHNWYMLECSSSFVPKLSVGGAKGEPGIHCILMRSISQKSWEIRNYCVISVQPWRRNVYLPPHGLHIFWPTMESFFFWVLVLLHSPVGRYFWYESQDNWGSYLFAEEIGLLPGKSVWWSVSVCHRL